MKDLSLNWDLDLLFPGGSNSPEYSRYLEELETEIKALGGRMEKAKFTLNNPEPLRQAVQDIQETRKKLSHASTFVSCLEAQNDQDKNARVLRGRVMQLGALFSTVLTKFDELIMAIPDGDWSELLNDDYLSQISFNLNERRTRAMDKLSAGKENLISDLAVDGYHGWSDVYSLAVSKVKIPVVRGGKVIELSAAQAANRLRSSDRTVREEVFNKWERAWGDVGDFCAAALNHLGGFRLNVYRHRGWNDILQEPLEVNRMTRETLEVMWDTINKNKQRLVKFLNRKKEVLGVDELSWHDVPAPLGQEESTLTFDEAANFVVDQLSQFSPRMAGLVTTALANHWVEAEDRPGKRPGAFCTSSPVLKQSRVFMTFSGTMGNVSTLAHELGHAYHQHVMNGLPQLAQGYAMNVAEAASTFSEMVVSDAALSNVQSDKEKLALLNDRLERTVALLMNIHARFLFETRFYEERKKGPLPTDRLNELMLEAQREAYCEALDVYHPHFWASKLHFYITGAPFYNFPYTFGFLFSAGVYARAKEEGPAFEESYIALLRDTGRMRVEDLARKHLDVDLTKPDFWQSAVDVATADLDEFLHLTEGH